jgi:hypothetical protein
MPQICEQCGIIVSEDEFNKKDHKEVAHSIDAFIYKRDENADIVDELPE